MDRPPGASRGFRFWPRNFCPNMGPHRAGGRVLLLCAIFVTLLLRPTDAAESRQPPGRPGRTRWLAGSARRELVQYDPQALCDLCEDNWLIVLGAAGRTGSTTAQSMLDAIPGFEIAGEHFGLLEDEHHSMKHYEESLRMKGTSWKHHASDLLAIRCSIQERMKRMVLGAEYRDMAPSVKVIGFKEVRYQSLVMLRFIHQVFPCARYVFTSRGNTEAEVKASAFGDGLKKNWASARETFTQVHDAFPDTHSMLQVEDLSTELYNRVLHDKLGVQGCSYSHILHDNADGSYKTDMTRDTLFTAECDLSGVDFRLSASELLKQEEAWLELYSAVHHWQHN